MSEYGERFAVLYEYEPGDPRYQVAVGELGMALQSTNDGRRTDVTKLLNQGDVAGAEELVYDILGGGGER